MSKKGIHPLAFVGAGCLVIIVIGVVVVAVLLKKGKDLVDDFTENPAKAIAEMAVKGDPNLTLVKSDDKAGTITFYDKRKQEEITVDWSAFKDGKLVVKQGEQVTSIEAGEGGAKIVGPDGTTTIGGSEGLKNLPAWVRPGTAGLTDLQSITHQEAADRVAGMVSGKSAKPAETLLAEIKQSFEAVGYKETSQATTRTEGVLRAFATFENEAEKRVLNYVVMEKDGASQVTVNYSQKK